MLRYGGGGGVGDPQATSDQRVENILSLTWLCGLRQVIDTNAKMSISSCVDAHHP